MVSTTVPRRLDGKDALVYRVGESAYYSNVALTDFVLFQESTLGPFLRDREARVYAPFSPAETDQAACLAYMDGLLALINR